MQNSLADRDGVIPYVLPKDNIPGYILIIVSIIILVLFWTFVFFKGFGGATTAETARIAGLGDKVYLTCPQGQCPTNIWNGEKRCSSDSSQSMLYDPEYEVCNSQFTCENTMTPYALNADGSTNDKGVCEEGTICRCLSKPQCPLYSTVLFEMKNGSEYLTGNQSTRYQIRQKPMDDQGNLGYQPINFANGNTQFCFVDPPSLNRLTPGACNFIGSPTAADMLSCVDKNPCINGILTYITRTDPREFVSSKDSVYYPLACVPGVKCPSNQFPVWDSGLGSIACIDQR